MSYEGIINQILGIGQPEKIEDFWKDNAEIPLFSKRPYDQYDSGIGEEDIVALKPGYDFFCY